MNRPVASTADRDQIALGIFTLMALEPNVVDINWSHQSTVLAPPAIPLQNPFARAVYAATSIRIRRCFGDS